MEDLKKIQEFFSKPLEEGKQLDIVDFAKVVQAVTKTGHPVTVLLTPKFNEIEVLTGMNAPDDMLFDLSNAVDSLGYGRNDIIIAADSSNLSRREYSDIRRVNGGHKDYFEESVNEEKKLTYNDFVRMVRDDMNAGSAPDEYVSDERIRKDAKYLYNRYLQGASVDDLFEATKEEETEFHTKLDKLVHDTFGKRKGEMEEEISDYEEKDADYDKLYSDYLYKLVREVAAEKGYSKYLVSKDNPKGETDGLTPATLNKILMNVIKDLDETIKLGKQLNEKLCPKGEAYRKKRLAAGEKSSAYLNGRAVKVCKGQMKG